MQRVLTDEWINKFDKFLKEEEKSPITIEKYIRDLYKFKQFIKEQKVTKELMISYKKNLVERGYADASINSMLASLNSFLRFANWQNCCVKGIKIQKQIYRTESEELLKVEYERLVKAAKRKERLKVLLQTICSTGIRVSEVKYFTVESVKKGEVHVSCKNKNRVVLLPNKLRKILLKYARTHNIKAGMIFVTRNGNPLNRSNIWKEMKNLCKLAQVNAAKVFPHSLRRLFARSFYQLDKDIAKLADILGHTSINTTRIYIMSSGAEHRRKIERLGLVIA